MPRTLALILALFLAPPAFAEPAGILTLDEALRLGLERNYGVRIARESAAQARAEGGYAKSGFLPRLDASGSWRIVDGTEQSNSPQSFGDTETESWTAGLSLNWTLFDGFAMFVDRARYDELTRLGETRARAAIEGQVLAIASAYFALVGQSLLDEVARENLAVSEDRLGREAVRRELGGLSTAEYLRAKVDTNADRALLLNRELAVTVARQELNLLLGSEPGAPIEVQREIELAPLGEEVSALLARARAGNSDLAAALLGRDLAGRELASANAGFWPSLSLTAGYDVANREITGDAIDGLIDTESTDLSYGLRVDWNLFDGDRKRVRRQSAAASARIAAIEWEEAGRRLETDLLTLVETYEQRLALAALEAENVAAARQSLELQAEAYAAGATTSLEFRDAQTALLSARSTLVSARTLARLTRLQIERLTGILPVG